MKKRMIMVIAAITMLTTGCAHISSSMLGYSGTETVMAASNKSGDEKAGEDKTDGGKAEEKNACRENPGEGKPGAAMTRNSQNSVSADFSVIDPDKLFTERDLEQTPDLSDAEKITVADGRDTIIDGEGTYVLTGNAKNASIIVEADDTEKIQLVLDGLVITNDDSPCIYIKSADKVFITTISDSNKLSVTGTFSADGDTNTDAVIFSKDDLVLNGTGSLDISSTDNGISGKDGIKLTGGSLRVECKGSAIEAHEEILVADGNLDITKCNDGLHAEENDDDTTGQIYIGGGSINISASDDAIHAATIVKIDDGKLTLSGSECIEGTAVQVNGGTIDITASDDGINAAQKTSSIYPVYEQNGGTVTIEMGSGDTDGVDSNGDIRINGGTISITGQSIFDYDGNAEYNGGTIIENGKETNTITNQFFGGHGGPGNMEMPERPENMEGMEKPENMEGFPKPGNMGGFGKHGRPDRFQGQRNMDSSGKPEN